MSECAAETVESLLRLNFATVWVRDQERSLRFFVEKAGFQVLADLSIPGHGRWVAVTPPSDAIIETAVGSPGLALVVPAEGSPEHSRIGQNTGLSFLTEDARAVYACWSQRGVRFPIPPRDPPWGSGQARFALFEDVDGNGFALMEFDDATRKMEAERQVRAARLNAEREASHDAAIAREVQRRLLPQRQPALRTLEYAGICLPARAVGGDYYDFLDFGRGKMGFVIGDIAGKGMAAALLMANLQASLRGQSATAWDEPAAFLRSVNQQFFTSTTDSGYATLFFADYDDESRLLRYANCGHPPAILLRRGGPVVKLGPTCTVMGLFEDWECAMEQVQLETGDTLLLFTDGATEASDGAGAEFGEGPLAELLRKHRTAGPAELLAAITREINRFSPGEQADDITLIAVSVS